jgi:MATE family multidrug resistance protein
LWITLAAIPANALVAYALIFGAFGLPRLEVLGAGVATTLVNVAMCAAAVWICYAQAPFRKYRVLGNFWRPDWRMMRHLVVLGAPISFAYALEYGLFAFAAIMMGWIGTVELAAHQIALQVASVMFMVPFGISMAATVRVGHAVGRGDAFATRRAGWTAIALGAAFMSVMVVVVALGRNVIPSIYLDPAPGEADATLTLAATLLVLGASFFIFDGVQTIAAGALRGLSDTRVPLAFAAFGFWGVGFTSAYALGFSAGLGAAGIWIGLSLGLVVYALLLAWRFRALTGRWHLPAQPARAARALGAAH